MALSGLDKAILEAHARYEGNPKLIGKHAREKMGVEAADMPTKQIEARLKTLLAGSNIEGAAFLEQERARDELRRLGNKEKLDAKAYDIQAGLLDLDVTMVSSASQRVRDAETTASWSKAVDSSVKLRKELKVKHLMYNVAAITQAMQENAQLLAEDAAVREAQGEDNRPQPLITAVMPKGTGDGQA